MKNKYIPLSLLAAFVTVFIAFPVIAADKPLDPCSLLTVEEIKSVIGKPVQPGKLKTQSNPAAGSDCTYVVGDYGSFNVLVKPLQAGETLEVLKKAFAKLKMTPTDVKDLGDGSFFTSPGYEMVQLHTIYKKRYILFTIMVTGMKEAAVRPLAEKLMRRAITRVL